MCHYAQLTFPVPAVIVVTLLAPTVDVEPVRPAPIVMVLLLGYRKITTPALPGSAGFWLFGGDEFSPTPEPPLPEFVTALVVYGF